MTDAPRWIGLAVIVALAVLAGCDDGSTKADRTPTTPASAPRPVTSVTGARPLQYDRVTFRGNLSLDGAPLDAEYLGAVVRRDGLVTPCQVSLPPVAQGRYEISLYANTESTGCGRAGSEVLLWTFTRGKTLYSDGGVPWPGSGHLQNFDAHFSTATPDGDVPPLASFNGDAFTVTGARLPAGAVVEAYVGTTRCGVASTRRTTDYSGFVLAVVGADAVAGCTRGAPIAFRVDGGAVNESAVNTPSTHGEELHLTVRPTP